MNEKKVTKKSKSKGSHYFCACGKRKTSSARVRIYPGGENKITVNNKDFKEYFPDPFQRVVSRSPFQFVEAGKKFDVTVRVVGGGVNSQAGAIKHGISKALILMNPDLRSSLKKAGFLTRDPRKKERKKPGLKRARRAPQWSKR